MCPFCSVCLQFGSYMWIFDQIKLNQHGVHLSACFSFCVVRRFHFRTIVLFWKARAEPVYSVLPELDSCAAQGAGSRTSEQKAGTHPALCHLCAPCSACFWFLTAASAEAPVFASSGPTEPGHRNGDREGSEEGKASSQCAPGVGLSRGTPWEGVRGPGAGGERSFSVTHKVFLCSLGDFNFETQSSRYLSVDGFLTFDSSLSLHDKL